MKWIRGLALAALPALLGAPQATAWVASGHARIAAAAAEALPGSVPSFVREGAARIGSSAMDPDFYRLRDLPQLRAVESPEHYLDSELLEGAEWPPFRYDYLELLARKDVDARKAGTLPYAILEGVQLLAAEFARIRLDPADEWAQARALHAAGILAHYAADLCQPLHTTIHFDGRARADGSSPRSGIHRKTDGLTTAVFRRGAPAVAPVEGTGDPWAAIRGEFAASHALVDRVYRLEDGMDPERTSAEAMAFANERVKASIRFTAVLLATAWERSGAVELPDWYRDLQARSEGASERASGAAVAGSSSPR